MKKLAAQLTRGRNFRPAPSSNEWATDTWQQAFASIRDSALISRLVHTDDPTLPGRIGSSFDIKKHRRSILYPAGGYGISKRPIQRDKLKRASDQAIEAIQAHLTITRVDKSESNFAFVCTEYYHWAVMQRLSSADFTRVGPDSESAGLAAQQWEAVQTTFRMPEPFVSEEYHPSDLRPFPPMIGTIKMKKLMDPTKSPEDRASLGSGI